MNAASLCPRGDDCALNSGARHCFHCGRNWPPDETWTSSEGQGAHPRTPSQSDAAARPEATLPGPESDPASVLAEVADERDRQDAKWGEQNHADGVWSLILGEEVGEAAQAALHAQFGGEAAGTLRDELIQVAAVAVQWVQALDRRQRRNEIAAASIKTADHFGVNGADTRV